MSTKYECIAIFLDEASACGMDFVVVLSYKIRKPAHDLPWGGTVDINSIYKRVDVHIQQSC